MSLDLNDPAVMRPTADMLPGISKSAVIVNGDTLYEVDRILDRRTAGRRVEYLVRYREYPVAPDRWVFKSALAHCAKAVGRFERNRRCEGGQPSSQRRRVHSPQGDHMVPAGDR